MQALVYNVTPPAWLARKAVGLVTPRAFYGAMSGLRLVEMPKPDLPGDDWVRLRTILGGICGTDLALVAQRNHPNTILRCFSSFPAVLGHENVCEIDAVGAEAGDWQRGVRVLVEPTLGCVGRGVNPPCAFCEAGLTSLCEAPTRGALPSRALIGLNTRTLGSWAPYFVAHRSQLYAVPDGIGDDVAVLIDPMASAAHAVLRRPPRSSEHVLVHGSGIVALGIIGAIRAMGFDNRITLFGRHAYQGELARAMGASDVVLLPRGASFLDRYEAAAKSSGGQRLKGTAGNQMLLGGFDLTYDCTGSGLGISDSCKWTRSRGTVVLVGTSSISMVDTTAVWFNELEIVGANGRQIETHGGHRRHTYEVLIDWITEGRIDLSLLPVTRYRLADYRSAFADLLARRRRGIVKAVFQHEDR